MCVYDGINDTLWSEYGVLKKVSDISGTVFNNFANWTQYDNNTAIFYQTWTVYNTDNIHDKSLVMYFGINIKTQKKTQNLKLKPFF